MMTPTRKQIMPTIGSERTPNSTKLSTAALIRMPLPRKGATIIHAKVSTISTDTRAPTASWLSAQRPT